MQCSFSRLVYKINQHETCLSRLLNIIFKASNCIYKRCFSAGSRFKPSFKSEPPVRGSSLAANLDPFIFNKLPSECVQLSEGGVSESSAAGRINCVIQQVGSRVSSQEEHPELQAADLHTNLTSLRFPTAHERNAGTA